MTAQTVLRADLLITIATVAAAFSVRTVLRHATQSVRLSV